ncbi:MAG: flagellar biosynthesis protein FlhF [Planctomycetota bacterium]
MHIRTFRAANLQAALSEIRRQMGPAASVLHTRQVRDGWLGWLGRTHVEVTAGLRDQNSSGSQDLHGGDGTPSSVAEVDSRISQLDARSAITSGMPRLYSSDDMANDANLRQESASLMPDASQIHFEELVQSGVPRQIADQWIDSTISFDAMSDQAPLTSWTQQLQRTVERNLRLSGPIQIQPGERHVVALIGPTGVGKTTTVAKLAAGFRIESRRRVGLVTIDTFRIAAVQQLKAYAEIMDLPMEVVEKREDMQPAMDRLGDVDLILIDTAGRSPRSDARVEQLVGFLEAASPDETHLVLSATSSAESILATCQGFAPARPTAAILTKLDETSHTAAVLAAVEAHQHNARGPSQTLPFSYVTHGQQVPDDIDVADAERLVERLLPLNVAGGDWSGNHFEAA